MDHLKERIERAIEDLQEDGYAWSSSPVAVIRDAMTEIDRLKGELANEVAKCKDAMAAESRAISRLIESARAFKAELARVGSPMPRATGVMPSSDPCVVCGKPAAMMFYDVATSKSRNYCQVHAERWMQGGGGG